MKRITATLTGIAAILICLGLSAAPAEAATRVANATVVYVHGLRNTNSGALNATAEAAPLASVLKAAGYTGPVVAAGYYYNDTADFSIDGAADSVAGPYNGTYDTNTPIERLAQDFAWYLYNTYTANGQTVSIAAHSMGGLITYYALTHVGQVGWPQSLLVQDVLTYSTPYKGVDKYPAGSNPTAYTASWCGTFTECNEAAIPGSPFLTDLAAQTFPSWVDYTVVGGGTTVNGVAGTGTTADLMNFASSGGIDAQHKVNYYATSPVNYAHMTYIQDTSTLKNEPVYYWNVGMATAYSNPNGSHSLAWGYAALASGSW